MGEGLAGQLLNDHQEQVVSWMRLTSAPRTTCDFNHDLWGRACCRRLKEGGEHGLGPRHDVELQVMSMIMIDPLSTLNGRKRIINRSSDNFYFLLLTTY
jgi:hypothetical protein